jgi:hypothetical protein
MELEPVSRAMGSTLPWGLTAQQHSAVGALMAHGKVDGPAHGVPHGFQENCGRR